MSLSGKSPLLGGAESKDPLNFPSSGDIFQRVLFEDLKAASECGKIVAAVLISPVRAQSAAGDESDSVCW